MSRETGPIGSLHSDKAEIRRLRVEVERLREALEPMRREADKADADLGIESENGWDLTYYTETEVSVGELHRARAALEGHDE